ncbi:MAG: hypothetical protein H7Y13_11350 [Sphingobacteriaceae bacterium]|nr:hypothetical protein [Sphingobacteriaceae bacterium]
MKTLSLFLLLISSNIFAQQAEERILYVVDSIPIIDEPEEGFGSLSQEAIHEVQVVTTKTKIEQHGFSDVDKLIFITTKEFFNRPPELREIPTVNAMQRKDDGKWYLKKSVQPYTGPFIDYFLDGKKQGEGNIKNGLVNGLRTVYYPNGKKSFYRTYDNSGIADGEAASFFSNGQIKNKGVFKNEKEDGIWQEWYSTGKLKRETAFKNGKALPTKEEEAFHSLLSKAGRLYKEENIMGAIKQLNKAIEMNPYYSDAFFERGTMKLNDFKFDEAIADFDKALEIEPLYMKAFTNRAFTRLRKYQLKNSRTLSKSNGVTVLASKDKVDIPAEELAKICNDLNKGYELGDRKEMVLQAIKDYCK